MFEPYPPFQNSLIKLVPAAKYQGNLDWNLTLDKPASIELAVKGLLLPYLARCVFNHSRFAHGGGLTIQFPKPGTVILTQQILGTTCFHIRGCCYPRIVTLRHRRSCSGKDEPVRICL